VTPGPHPSSLASNRRLPELRLPAYGLQRTLALHSWPRPIPLPHWPTDQSVRQLPRAPARRLLLITVGPRACLHPQATLHMGRCARRYRTPGTKCRPAPAWATCATKLVNCEAYGYCGIEEERGGERKLREKGLGNSGKTHRAFV
jgi:hypothetical protein